MKKVILISNGDFRDAVGVNCWPKQEETLREAEKAFGSLGIETERGNPFKDNLNHGFITTQAEGCLVFSKIDPELPVVIVLASWVYAHHVASSLKLHEGPILLLGNFDGEWPGLVALLNHSATLDRMAISHSKIWSDGFSSDQNFMNRLSRWIDKGSIDYPTDHITPLSSLKISKEAESFGHELAQDILKRKRILGLTPFWEVSSKMTSPIPTGAIAASASGMKLIKRRVMAFLLSQ